LLKKNELKRRVSLLSRRKLNRLDLPLKSKKKNKRGLPLRKLNLRDLVKLRRRQKLNKPKLSLKSNRKKKSDLLLPRKPGSPPWLKRKRLRMLALLRKCVSLLS
jgi:hypothetical protein